MNETLRMESSGRICHDFSAADCREYLRMDCRTPHNRKTHRYPFFFTEAGAFFIYFSIFSITQVWFFSLS